MLERENKNREEKKLSENVRILSRTKNTNSWTDRAHRVHRTMYENHATPGPLASPFRTMVLKILKELDKSSEHPSHGSAADGYHISGNVASSWQSNSASETGISVTLSSLLHGGK